MYLSVAYVPDLKERLRKTCKMANDMLGKSHEKYKKYNDGKTKTSFIKVGGLLLVLLPNRNKLLMQRKVT